MKLISIKSVGIAALAIALASCGPNSTANKTPAPNDAKEFDARYLTEAPANAKQISSVFAKVNPGEEVILSGEIMGRSQPFVEGRAMFLLGDPTKLTPCNRIPGDGCKKPWDNCCDDPDVKKVSVATIQLLDEDGQVIKSNLKGYQGIAEQSFVTVSGTVAEGSNAENLLITAKGFHVAKESPYKDAPPVSSETEEDEKSEE